MEIRLLGPVEMWAFGDRVDLGPPQRRAVLAALAADAGRPVPTETLIDRVWGERPPPRVRSAVHANVTHLRRLLVMTGADMDEQPRPALVRQSGGYTLQVDQQQIDLHRFRTLASRARHRRCPDSERATILREALDLWRGQALSGVAGQWPALTRSRWSMERLDAAVDWAHAELDLRHYDHVISAVRALLADYPLAEPLIVVLMRALYATGRRAEALESYATTRTHLAEELGADPGPELQALHHAILRGDADPPASRSSPVTVPALLPMDIQSFTGRRRELALLDAAHAASGAHPTAVIVAAVSGTAGVGKTALAVHWAHRVREQFPDGQLYVNLRGFDASSAPMTTAEAVRLLLDALGVPQERIPAEAAAAAALYRTTAAGQQLLILLDNAADAAQVRPLLPGAAGCLVVVTSRDQLAGLVAAEGAHPVSLDLLSPDEARSMLARRLGNGRTNAESAAVNEIVALCARLPLALALVAARAAANPRFGLARLAEELRADHLDVLRSGDPATEVRNVFSWSYRWLTAPAARLFRLLGLHPAVDISAATAASLAALPPATTRTLLAELARAHLVAEPSPGRYCLHDLLRAYARELAAASDPDNDRAAAVHRVLDHYLHTAEAAVALVEPHREPVVQTPAVPGVTAELFTNDQQALAWFTSQRETLLAGVRLAADAGFDQHVWRLARVFAGLLHNLGWWQDLIAVEELAIEVTARLNEHAERAWAERLLGRAYASLRHFHQAHTAYRHALVAYEQLDDRVGQAAVHFALACLGESSGDDEALGRHSTEALRLYAESGYRLGTARALNLVGWVHAQRREYNEALAECGRALALQQEIGDWVGEAATRDSIGYVQHHRAQYAQALDSYAHALTLYQRCGDRANQADVLTHLGETHRATGDLDAARRTWQRAEHILIELGDAAANEVHRRVAELTRG